MDAALKKEPLFSNRALVSLVLPVIFESIFFMLTRLVDSAMLAPIGAAAVSAVTLADSIIIIPNGFFLAMASGAAVVTAQYIGSRDLERASESMRQVMYLITFSSVILCYIAAPFSSGITKFIYPSLEAETFECTKTYLFWALIGIPFAAIGNACTGLLRVQSKSRLALYLSVIMNVLNVIGNAILIYGFKMGIAGAAISTTIARCVFGILGIVFLHSKSLLVSFKNLFKLSFDFGIIKKVVSIGFANGVENLFLFGGNLLLSIYISTLGTTSIAANTVVNTLCELGLMTISVGLANPLLTVVGQCIGADEKDQAKSYTIKFMKIATITSTVLFGATFLLRAKLVLLFKLDAETLALAAKYLGIACICAVFFLYSISIIPLAAFRAAGDTRFAVITSLVGMLGFRVGLTLFFGFFFKLGLWAIWIGTSADWIFRVICGLIRFKNGKWLDKKVV